MRELRKKQARLYKIMKGFLIAAAVVIVVYIGAEPYVAKASQTAAIVMNYVCDALVLGAMFVIFAYYNKYGKSDAFLTRVEHEIDDAGYYLTAREEKTTEQYVDAMFNDLKSCGFAMDKNIEIDDFDFDIRAYKKKEFFYAVQVEALNRDDVLAYSDVAVNDLTVQKLKRKGDCVICFVTDKADDSAIAISKVITPFGRKEQLKVSYAIAEVQTGRVYFLGNMATKLQQMTANYVMNCDVPIKDEYIGKERLPFQDELEERMKSFTIAEFRNGTFYTH